MFLQKLTTIISCSRNRIRQTRGRDETQGLDDENVKNLCHVKSQQCFSAEQRKRERERERAVSYYVMIKNGAMT